MTEPVRKAILIAAGRGRRLGNHTDAIPKCLVPVGGKPMLAWQWAGWAAAGIDELVVIRGYLGDVLTRYVETELTPRPRRVVFVDNHAWPTNNILLSLACARAELDAPTLLSYSDIIYTPAVAAAVVASPAEIALVVDRLFRDIYVGRTEHPLDEGEVCDTRADGNLHRVGKRSLPPADAVGEFIGLCKLGPQGVRWTADAIDALQAQFAGRDDQPFQRATTFRNAYLTDLWQHLIDGGRPLAPVFIDGGWREIDTGQDLARAEELVQASTGSL